MDSSNNLMELCFSITDMYEQSFRNKLCENGLNKDDVDSIVNNFDFKRDIIFSLNKEFKKGKRLDEFCIENHMDKSIPDMLKFHGQLYHHQEEAIKSILSDKFTVISTGTGSGKTESFLIPILNYCLSCASKGIKAVIIYPMNALAGDQMRRIAEAVEGTGITYGVFTGATPQKNDDTNLSNALNGNQIVSREDMKEKLPDILITNYVMLDYILTDTSKRAMFERSKPVLKYVVLDEIHTYRGNKGADIKLLLQRFNEYTTDGVVQIGCSATLSRSREGIKQEGYIAGNEIDNFIKRMFSVENYNYIEPQYEQTNALSNEVNDRGYIKLMDNPITRHVRDFLNEKTCSLTEILGCLNNKGIRISPEGFKEYLKEIVEMNNKYPDCPLLDLRVHVFLLEINNVLKRCINCGRYHTSNLKICSSCGHPVFPVYKHDYTKCIGKVRGRYLKADASWRLEDDASTFYVLIENRKLGLTGETINGDVLPFKAYYQMAGEDIRMEYDKDGDLKLYYFPDMNDLEESIIQLGRSYKKEFLYNIFKYSLLNLKGEERKILSFIDNRESAGRYSSVFNDEFLSQFYLECIKLVNSRSRNLSIADAYDLACEELRGVLAEYCDEETARNLLEDFNIWYTRAISIPQGSELEKTPSLKLIDENLIKNDGERDFIDILTGERILDRNPVREKGRFIRFHCGYSRLKRGAIIKNISTENSNLYDYISFTQSAQKYRGFIDRYAGKLENIVETLVNKGILKEECIDKGEYIYFLIPKKIRFELEDSNYSCMDEIISRELLFAGAHSSEVSGETRYSHEREFEKGGLNLLVSTPTLEMGIDIGKLNLVYMIGVPPMPSNYAQRAGRAGRRGNKFALFITICSEGNNHDMYYFNNPSEMIEGVISPPVFDDKNVQLIKKHINALLIPGAGREMLADRDPENIERIIQKCTSIFGNAADFRSHIGALRKCIEGGKITNLGQKNLYDMAVYPDYGFRKDEVKAVDAEYKEALKKGGDVDEKDFTASSRDPEQAYRDFVPDSSMFLGEDYYKFTYDGDYTEVDAGEDIPMRQYSPIYCTNRVQNINKSRDTVSYITSIKITPKMEDAHERLNRNEIVTAWLEKDLPIYLINRGKRTKEGAKAFSSDGKTFYIGYKLVRNSILFEFNNDVVGEKYFISFCAALDRTIKYLLGLDESEIGWIIDDIEFEGMDDNKRYSIMYDKAGSRNIDMKRIHSILMDILSAGHRKMTNCSCSTSGGCYLCMKGYTIQRYSPLINKNMAAVFLGYLIGINKFKPQISIKDEILYYDMELDLKLDTARKHIIISQGNNIVADQAYTNDNETVFSSICEIMKKNIDNEEVESIQINAKQDYIVKAINGDGSVNSGVEQFRLLKFYGLRFKDVKGVKM